MKTAELRKKTRDELNVELQKLLEQQFRNNMQKATGQLGQSHLLKQGRRNIARIKTVLGENVGDKS